MRNTRTAQQQLTSNRTRVLDEPVCTGSCSFECVFYSATHIRAICSLGHHRTNSSYVTPAWQSVVPAARIYPSLYVQTDGCCSNPPMLPLQYLHEYNTSTPRRPTAQHMTFAAARAQHSEREHQSILRDFVPSNFPPYGCHRSSRPRHVPSPDLRSHRRSNVPKHRLRCRPLPCSPEHIMPIHRYLRRSVRTERPNGRAVDPSFLPHDCPPVSPVRA